MRKKINKQELYKIVINEANKIHRKTLIENRLKEIDEEISGMVSEVEGEGDKEILDRIDFIYNSIKKRGLNPSIENIVIGSLFSPGGTLVGHEESIKHALEDKEGLGQMDDGNLNESNIMGKEQYEILEGYLEAALWAEEDEIGPSNVYDISDESRNKANEDVLEFMNKAGDLLNGIEPSQIGHDLWLTRNGHGAGFWGRGLGEVGEQLSEIAKEMGEKFVYRGDDGEIYIE